MTGTWKADSTPAFSSIYIQREILDQRGIFYSIRYGFDTIEVDIQTNLLEVAEMVKLDFTRQNIPAEITKTKQGFIISRCHKGL